MTVYIGNAVGDEHGRASGGDAGNQESYFSIAEAARRNGVTVMAISNACNGKTKTSCGRLFSFQGGVVNVSRVS